MKKTLVVGVAVLGMVTYTFGQGEVFFANTAGSGTHIYTNNTFNTPSPTVAGGTGRLAPGQGSAFTFALFSANNSVLDILDPSDDVVGQAPWLDPRWSFTGVYATNTTSLGRIAIKNPNAGGAAVVPGQAVGTTASLSVVGWNTSFGGDTLQSFMDAYNAANSGALGLVWGYSSVAHILLGNGASPPNSFLFGAGTGQIGGFTLSPADRKSVV